PVRFRNLERIERARLATGKHIPAINGEEARHHRGDCPQHKFRLPPFLCLHDKLLPVVNGKLNVPLLGLTLAIYGTDVTKLLHALWTDRLAADMTGVGGRFLPVFRTE